MFPRSCIASCCEQLGAVGRCLDVHWRMHVYVNEYDACTYTYTYAYIYIHVYVHIHMSYSVPWMLGSTGYGFHHNAMFQDLGVKSSF